MNRYHNDYDSQKVTELLELAKGNRTAEEYARQAGISPSSFSKVLSGYYRATERFIRLLTSDKAMPRGGVTYDLLIKAAGLEEKSVDTCGDGDTLIVSVEAGGRRDPKEEVEFQKNSVIRRLLSYYKIMSSKYELNEKNKSFSPNETFRVINEEGDVIQWWFYFMKPISKGGKGKPRYAGGRQNNFSTASSLFFLYPDPARKISICYTDREEFINALNAFSMNSFKGDLSLILINGETGDIEEEEQVSSYSEDHSTAFPIK